MKTLLVVLATTIILFSVSCSNEKTKEKKKAIVKQESLIIGDPFNYGIENMLIFPIGTNYQPMVYENEKPTDYNLNEITVGFTANAGTFNDRWAEEEYINTNENEFDIQNILFYDLETTKSYKLFSDTMHILSFSVHSEFSNPMIVYRIVKTDNNKDSLYNSKDPVILYVSDLYGKNMVQISPDDEKFIDYFYYPEKNIILIKTIVDSNKDKNFLFSDETNFREMKINEPGPGRELFTNSMKDSLRIK
ncbi:MAG: hypothetical protein A2W91_01495 [Bacteroidetes bacterium GWF2_38_335]|nr:MAG: hypothetical protein A2W91_01495 [Bacteroidetes bacterium GWF2_38_335]OFY78749.1 MAG: hypothetical protein A2281_19070 [Bacteroidetes bacterium RIFOXYA12_FULL_38_20]HBS85137.1 hypothetical protein [Bacteroidales bacterium]